jgi:hypothetical protein
MTSPASGWVSKWIFLCAFIISIGIEWAGNDADDLFDAKPITPPNQHPVIRKMPKAQPNDTKIH